MPDLSTVALVAVACLALTATPGPDMLLIASRSASQGRVAGFAGSVALQIMVLATVLNAIGLVVNGGSSSTRGADY